MQISTTYLKKLRKQKGWTQEDLSKLTRISQAHIAKIETGQIDPRLSTVNKLLKALTEDSIADDNEPIQRIMSRNVVYCDPEETLAVVSIKMLKFGYSMLPVKTGSGADMKITGNLTEKSLFQAMMNKKDLSGIKVKAVMEKALPTAPMDTRIGEVGSIIGERGGVLIIDPKTGTPAGIITRNDLFKTIIP